MRWPLIRSTLASGFFAVVLTITTTLPMVASATARSCGAVFATKISTAEKPFSVEAYFKQSQADLSISDRANVIVDPGYDESGHRLAHYDGETHTIFLSQRSIDLYLANQQDTFRHELQHHREQLKMEQGEFSLRRFAFAKNSSAPNNVGDADATFLDSYSGFFRFDELETHLGDLKSLRARKVSGPLVGRTAELLKKLIVDAKTQLELLETKFVDRKFTGAEMMSMMASPWGSGLEPAHPPMNKSYIFETTGGGIEIYQSLKKSYPQKPKRSEISQGLIDSLYDGLDRIDAIEQELNSLKF